MRSSYSPLARAGLPRSKECQNLLVAELNNLQGAVHLISELALIHCLPAGDHYPALLVPSKVRAWAAHRRASRPAAFPKLEALPESQPRHSWKAAGSHTPTEQDEFVPFVLRPAKAPLTVN